MKIVILNECFLSEQQMNELKVNNHITFFEITATEDEAKERIKNAEVIFVDQFVCPLSSDVLDEARDLKLVIVNSTSYHILDAEYLKSRSISLCNTPDFCSDSVAEVTFLYVLSLTKNSMSAYKDNLEKPFEILPDDMSHRKYIGKNLNEKTIGIIGLGNIGQKIGLIAQGFNMNILGFNRSEKNISGIQQTSLDELLTVSDIIIVTVPYSEKTHELLNEEKINLMKKGVVIVNISSQDILNEETLVQKLQNDEIGGYGLDSFTNKDKEHYFYNSEKVMILPHLGFFTQESLDMIGVRMMESFHGFVEGKDTHRIL